jgi:F0F1-type ATP synthase assembly protein I
MKFAGLGMELAGSTLGLAAVGYLVDRYRGTEDGYGTAAGALIGFLFGMYRLIQQAMRAVQDQTK